MIFFFFFLFSGDNRPAVFIRNQFLCTYKYILDVLIILCFRITITRTAGELVRACVEKFFLGLSAWFHRLGHRRSVNTCRRRRRRLWTDIRRSRQILVINHTYAHNNKFIYRRYATQVQRVISVSVHTKCFTVNIRYTLGVRIIFIKILYYENRGFRPSCCTSKHRG